MTTERVIRSRMMDVVLQKRTGVARESYNPWTTGDFDRFDPSQLNIPASEQNHEMRVWSKARVMKRFAGYGVNVDAIAQDVYEEIVGVLVTSKSRWGRRYVDWSKVPDESVFGEFAPTVRQLRTNVVRSVHVNEFLDALARSGAAPKKPTGTSSGGGTKRIADMSAYELMGRYGGHKRTRLDGAVAGTPGMGAVALDMVTGASGLRAGGVLASAKAYLSNKVQSLTNSWCRGGMALRPVAVVR